MARLLAYVDAVPGRLYPLVATLIELTQRPPHRGAVRDRRFRAAVPARFDVRPLRSEIERFPQCSLGVFRRPAALEFCLCGKSAARSG